MRLSVVGITGYAGVGKSTLASYLSQNHGYTIVSLADPLKAAARCLGWDGEKDAKGRDFLQRLGTEAIRDTFGVDFWVNLLVDNLCLATFKGQRYVVPDVRFINEADRLRYVFRSRFSLIRVFREGIGPCNTHVSETEQKGMEVDFRVTNNEGYPYDMCEMVRDFLRSRGDIG